MTSQLRSVPCENTVDSRAINVREDNESEVTATNEDGVTKKSSMQSRRASTPVINALEETEDVESGLLPVSPEVKKFLGGKKNLWDDYLNNLKKEPSLPDMV